MPQLIRRKRPSRLPGEGRAELPLRPVIASHKLTFRLDYCRDRVKTSREKESNLSVFATVRKFNFKYNHANNLCCCTVFVRKTTTTKNKQNQ